MARRNWCFAKTKAPATRYAVVVAHLHGGWLALDYCLMQRATARTFVCKPANNACARESAAVSKVTSAGYQGALQLAFAKRGRQRIKHINFTSLTHRRR